MPNRHLKTHQEIRPVRPGSYQSHRAVVAHTQCRLRRVAGHAARGASAGSASSVECRFASVLLPTRRRQCRFESGYSESTWTQKTDIEAFFADKNVNVVLPVGGTGSFYTNWKNDDPNLGVNKWESFLAEELPALIDSAFSGNGTNVVAGCPWVRSARPTSSHITRSSIPDWPRTVAVSTTPNRPRRIPCGSPWPARRATPPTCGARRRTPTGKSTTRPPTRKRCVGRRSTCPPVQVRRRIRQRLHPEWTADCHRRGDRSRRSLIRAHNCSKRGWGELSIPAVFAYRNDGTHSWPYWQDALHDSWPTVKTALGM